MTEEIIVPVNALKALHICEQAIQELGWQLEEINETRIVASTLASIRSFGERIYISIEEAGTTKTSIKVESQTKFIFQIFDWGKNKENKIRFINLIKDITGELL